MQKDKHKIMFALAIRVIPEQIWRLPIGATERFKVTCLGSVYLPVY